MGIKTKMNRHLPMLLLMFFTCLTALPAVSAAADDNAMYYTDIPGITQSEIECIERLKRHRPDGFRYAMMYSDEAFIGSDGNIGGFARFMCEWLGDFFGIAVKPDIVAWNDLLSGLEAHEIDFSGELTATPQRRGKYYMTDSIAERSFIVFHRAEDHDIDLINGEGILRYGFLKGSVTYERVLETSEVPFMEFFLDNYHDAVEAMRNGDIDVFVCEGTMGSAFEDYPDIAYQKYYPVAYTSVSLSTANPELFPIIDVVQKYLDNGGKDYLVKLYQEGEQEYLRYRFRRQLSGEECALIDNYAEKGLAVPLVAEFDNYPVSFYNRHEAQWQGIAHDVLREIGALSGLSFKIVNAPDEDWNEILHRLETGEAAMCTHLARSKERKDRFLWSCTPYCTDRYALLSCSHLDDIPANRVFQARVGLVRGTAYEEIFHQIYPNHPNTMVYPDTLVAFEKLEAGEVDLVMMTRNLMRSVTNYMERPGFKVNVPLDTACDSYFGFHKDQALLRSVISKAQNLVDCAGIADRWERKTFDYNKKTAQEKIPYLIIMFSLPLGMLVFLIILFKRRERSSRLLGMTDPLTQLPNRRAFDDTLRREWKKAMKNRLYLSLLVLDVDYFKRYNDTYGHPQGDLLLQAISNIFKNSLMRPDDMVARVGGEEFVVILSNTGEGGAHYVAETIRSRVEEAVVKNVEDGQPTNVTVSIGIATIKPGPDDRMKDFVCRSDKALYAAKAAGRNCVRCG